MFFMKRLQIYFMLTNSCNDEVLNMLRHVEKKIEKIKDEETLKKTLREKIFYVETVKTGVVIPSTISMQIIQETCQEKKVIIRILKEQEAEEIKKLFKEELLQRIKNKGNKKSTEEIMVM